MRMREIVQKKHGGFTLVELLITIVVGSIVMGSVSLLMAAFFKSFNMHDDLAKAQQNGELGLQLIERYVLEAGMGIPNRSADYQSAFSIAPTPPWGGWGGPISLDSSSVNILWGKPLTNVGSVEEEKIEISGTTLDISSLPGEVKQGDWVIFPSSTLPFYCNSAPSGGASGASLTLQSVSSDTIYRFDAMYLLHQVNVSVSSNVLTLSVQSASGFSTEGINVSGIADVYAGWIPDGDPEGRLLWVVLLARGSEKQKQPLEAPPGWPGGALTGDERYYRHMAVGRIWRIRN